MKKKILYLITQSQWGGAQKYVFDLANNLKEDFDITVACGGNGRLIRELRGGGIRTVFFPMLVRPINPIMDLICFLQLLLFIKKEKFDIVHTNSSKAEILGNIAARLAGAPKIIFTAHGFYFNEPMSDWKKRLFIFLERFANRFCDKIIAVSDFDRNRAIEEGIVSEEKIIRIYNGVDVSNETRSLDSTTLRSVSLEMTDVKIGTIANLYPNKGLKHLIEAIPRVIEKNKNIKFIIIGDGPQKKELLKLIEKLNIENYIDLLGEKENAVNYLKTFDIFVLSSVKEGCPYTILEAIVAGVPIISTHVGGIPEIINPPLIPPLKKGDIVEEEPGILIPHKNSQEIANAINYLIENPEVRETLSNNAKEKIKEFGLENMIIEIKNEY